ncbi:MAG TPA: TOBE domain-containing protein [Myxococcota bacterium]|jgi:molybdopterin-binding protein|nr:TOBE domain-containing protein [Myxococcota bacterium]
MKVGARNQIVGTVTAVKRGAVMCQVNVDVPAAKMSSVMTLDSCDDMALAPGDKVRVVVKAIQVLLLKE